MKEILNQKALLILLFSFLLASSCGYRFVNKRYVVQDSKGYLVFKEGEAIFFPYADTIDSVFLKEKKKTQGFRIGYDTYLLDSISTNYDNLLYIKNDKKFSIIPVEIRYYLGSGWQKKDEVSTVDYKFENDTFQLSYKIHDWRNVLEVNLIRQSDIARLKDLNIEWPPLHYQINNR